MANITIGQYSVSNCKVKVKTSGASGQAVYSLSIESNTETWYSINDGGWQNALLTAKALSGSFSGKRTLGDTGNDYVEGLRYKLAKDAEADWEIDFPDGSKLEFTAVTALTDILGAATDVAPLSGDITCKGKPTFTAATTG